MQEALATVRREGTTASLEARAIPFETRAKLAGVAEAEALQDGCCARDAHPAKETDPLGGEREAAMSEPRPGFEDGRYRVSPHNFDPTVQQQHEFPQPLTIFDSTIRKILLTSGLRPSVDDMLRVAEGLAEAGVRDVFLNVSWWGDRTPCQLEYEVCRAILTRNLGFRVSVFADGVAPLQLRAPGAERMAGEMMREAVETLAKAGVKAVTVPVSDPGDDAARVKQLDGLAETFAVAKQTGLAAMASILDCGRMDFDYLVRIANATLRMGAERVDLLDSFSSLCPEGLKFFMRRLRARLEKRVQTTMHIHNDFGLGAAGAIAAAAAGAHPDVAVNGLSYRSGFAALEEVVLSLETLYGVRTGIKVGKLQALSELVERYSLPNHPLKPVTGPHAFLRDLPVWMHPLIECGLDAFPPPASCVAPSLVGTRMRLVWSYRHSNFLVRAKLDRMGLDGSDHEVREIRRQIDARLGSLKGYPIWITDEEVEGICRRVVGDSTHRAGDVEQVVD